MRTYTHAMPLFGRGDPDRARSKAWKGLDGSQFVRGALISTIGTSRLSLTDPASISILADLQSWIWPSMSALAQGIDLHTTIESGPEIPIPGADEQKLLKAGYTPHEARIAGWQKAATAMPVIAGEIVKECVALPSEEIRKSTKPRAYFELLAPAPEHTVHPDAYSLYYMDLIKSGESFFDATEERRHQVALEGPWTLMPSVAPMPLPRLGEGYRPILTALQPLQRLLGALLGEGVSMSIEPDEGEAMARVALGLDPDVGAAASLGKAGPGHDAR